MLYTEAGEMLALTAPDLGTSIIELDESPFAGAAIPLPGAAALLIIGLTWVRRHRA